MTIVSPEASTPAEAKAKLRVPATFKPGGKGVRVIKSIVRALFPIVIVAAAVYVTQQNWPTSVDYILSHGGIVVWALIFISTPIVWGVIGSTRRRKAADKNAKTPKDPPRPIRRALRDWIDLFLFVDTRTWRIIYLALTAATIYAIIAYPVGRTGKTAPFDVKNLETLTTGWTIGGENLTYEIIPLAMPIVWFLVVANRMHSIYAKRQGTIETIYAIAQGSLKYPVKQRPSKDEIKFQTPNGAIRVDSWRNLVDPEKFWISAPITLDAGDNSAWNTLNANLEQKVPADEGWHIDQDPRGRGADVRPSTYPIGVQWKGEYVTDPLTFIIGADLDNPDIPLQLTLGEVSPHMLTVGPTGSGKAVSLDSYLPTPTGSKLVRDIAIGDTLLDERGIPCAVTALSPITTPAVAYRVTFSDGTTINADAGHRWWVYGQEARQPQLVESSQPWLPVDVRARLRAAANDCEPGDEITVEQVLQMLPDEASELVCELAASIGVSREVHAGVSLPAGGGTVTEGSLTCYYPKRDLLLRVAERGEWPPSDRRYLQTVPRIRTTQDMVDAGVVTNSGDLNFSVKTASPIQLPEAELPWNPYTLGAQLGARTGRVDRYPATTADGVGRIPMRYLRGSVDQRLALLQGLMDAAGSAASGICRFRHSDRKFAEQVRSLIASLGMQATLHTDDAGCAVTFVASLTVFRDAQKADRLDLVAGQVVNEHRYITRIERIDSVPMRCIGVDSPSHLFLITDQFVPTHNTSAVEAIMAQAAVKPMPWDPNLFAEVHVVDPKGPFANRWENRPNLWVTNGTRDSINDDGDDISGIEAMALHVERVYNAMLARQKILDSYAGAGKWLDIPDHDKASLKLAPVFLCMDEFLDHVGKDPGKQEQVERNNAAREQLMYYCGEIARKGRSLGFHMLVIAQEAKLTSIGSSLMRQLVCRIMMSNMDQYAYQSIFGTPDVPVLPNTRIVNGRRKTIPGRGRMQNASGQPINRMQVYWFGGDENSESLEKYLQRSTDGEVVKPIGIPIGEGNVTPDIGIEGKGYVPPNTPDRVFAPPKPKPLPADGPLTADDLFGPDDTSSASPEPVVAEEDRCLVPMCGVAGVACVRCQKAVCEAHATRPDGKVRVCSGCAQGHALVKAGLGTLYPQMVATVERAAGTIGWAREGQSVKVVVNKSGVEVMQLTASAEAGIMAIDGTSVATDNKSVMAMLRGHLR